MADNPCLDLVRQSIPDMSAKEVAEVVDLMKTEQASLMKQGMTASDAAKAASTKVAGDIRAAIKIERRNAAINRRIRLENLDHVLSGWEDDPVEGILSTLYGSPKSRPNSRTSAGAAQSANLRRYLGGLERELRESGLYDVIRRREMDDDIADALWNIEDEVALASIPSSAVKAAKILRKWQEVSRLEANRHGAWIGKAKNYITRQTNNSDRIAQMGIVKWKELAGKHFDFDKIFSETEEHPINIDSWLTEAYNNITTGVRPRTRADSTAERMGAFKGPRNLAKKVSAERVFYFKSAKDWAAYNREAGAGSLMETYVNELHRRSESTGLMQMWGTNPEYNLDAVVKAVRTTLSRSNPEALRRFDSKSRGGGKFEDAMRELTGYTRTIASSNLANIGAGVRFWNAVTSLGTAVLQAVGDVPLRASALRYQGDSFLGNLAKGTIAPLKRVLAGAGSLERQAVLNGLGHFNDVSMRNIVSRFSPDENLPGKIQAASNTYFKWNLLGQWTEEGRRSALEAMGNFLGEHHEQGWSGLSEQTQRSLVRFGIGEKEWGLVRQGLVEDDNGVKFLTPDKIRELPVDIFTELAGPRIEAVQRGLLESVQKRQKADARQQAWIDKRHADFTDKLEKANQRLLELAERRAQRAASRAELLKGRIDETVTAAEKKADEAEQAAFDTLVEKVGALNQRIGELTIQLETIRDWWKNNFDFDLAPTYGKRVIREAGIQEGTLRAKHAQARREFFKAKHEFSKKMDEAVSSVEGLRSELTSRAEDEIDAVDAATRQDINDHYEAFNQSWKERHAELREYIGELESKMAERRAETAGDLDKLGGQIERVLDDTRASVADKLQRYYADEVDSAIITPDARTMAFAHRGTQKGTTMGEALRLFWQFKSFPIGVIQRGFMREFYGYDKGRGGRFGMSEIKGLALLMVASTAYGYLGMTLKDLARGRLPRAPDDWRTWRDSMAQGGSLGIYGDYLTGTQARFGRGFLSQLGGPTVGKADELLGIAQAIQTGQDPRAKMLKFAVSQVPYNNLFYTKAATDYLFMYELQEAMNPGYLRRFERNITDETGAEWWLRPSEVAR